MNIIFHSVNDLPVGQCIDNGYISLADIAKSQDRLLESWLFLKETTLLLKEFKETPEYAKLEPVITAEGEANSIWAHPDVAIPAFLTS